MKRSSRSKRNNEEIVKEQTKRKERAVVLKDEPEDDADSGISAYEATRLQNIARNTEVLEGLGIDTATSQIREKVQPKVFAKSEKRPREQRESTRRSLRGKDADGNAVAPMPIAVEEPIEEHLAPVGPVDMRGGGEDLSEFANTLQKLVSSATGSSGKKGESKSGLQLDTHYYSTMTLGNDSKCTYARVASRY